MEIVSTKMYSDGLKEIVINCIKETSPDSPLRFVRVLEHPSSFSDGTKRKFIGEKTNIFDTNTCKSKQRLNLINKINNILDSTTNK